MTTRLIALTNTIGAAPGEVVVGRVDLHNDAASEATYSLEVVGLDPGGLDDDPPPPPLTVHVPAGGSAICEIPFRVPRSLGIGQHAAAFSVMSDRPGDRPALTPFTVAIASVERVDLVPQPATIRARRRAGFHLDITNREPQPVSVTLDGDAPDVSVSFAPDTLRLQPGQRAVAKGTVKGPRRWTGEPTQHNILITARGQASSTSVTAAYVQRPLFAHRLRMAVAALTVVSLWIGAIIVVGVWWSNRESTTAVAQIEGVDTTNDGKIDTFRDADGRPVNATDTNGDGIPDSFVDADGVAIVGTDTDGDGIPDTIVSPGGDKIEAVDTDGDGTPDALTDGSWQPSDGEIADPGPRSTVVRGTLKVDGSLDDVQIQLVPISASEAPSPTSAALGFSGGGSNASAGKIWSARVGRVGSAITPIRQTEPIAPLPGPQEKVPDANGLWLFSDVELLKTYELVFSKPGFETQSFVISVTGDDTPIALDVELVPGRGSLEGRVVDPSGRALGGAEIVVTDGTLTFTTTSATAGDVGSWSLDGISTPGVYTASAALRGYGTAVVQVPLDADENAAGVDFVMRPGVGTISGLVRDGSGRPIGGVAVTATNGDVSLTSSTLTEGNVGFYSLPQLPVGSNVTYTVKAELDGFITQTRRVPLGGSLGNVDFDMTRTTLTLAGKISSANGGGIAGAGVLLTTGDLTFRVPVDSTEGPSAGNFTIDNLPPGNYTVTAEHYKHVTATQFLTLQAGVVPPPVNITLEATSGPPAVGTGTLSVSVINDDPTVLTQAISGAVVELTRNRSGVGPQRYRAVAGTVDIPNLAIGTWTLRVFAPCVPAEPDPYKPCVNQKFSNSPPQQVQISLNVNNKLEPIRLKEKGQASGEMVDASNPAKVLPGPYFVTVYGPGGGQCGDTEPQFCQPIGRYPALQVEVAVGDGQPPKTTWRWQTEANKLSAGVYRLHVAPGDAPAGYVVRNTQVLDTTLGVPMRFRVPDVDKAKVEQVFLPAIQADSYPTLSGRVFKPVLDGSNVTFAALDAASLAVSAVCSGTEVTGTELPGSIVPGSGFQISNLQLATVIRQSTLLASSGVGPACELTVTADGYEPTSFTIANLQAGVGTATGNRKVNSALVAEPPPLTGSVYWVDARAPTTKILVPDVTVTGIQAITGFEAVEASAIVSDPFPKILPSPMTDLTAVSGSDGTWTIPGQVFGTAEYTFTKAGFSTGRISVTIDQTAQPVVARVDKVEVTRCPPLPPEAWRCPDDASPALPQFAIELVPPDKGTVKGQVTILTSRADPAYSSVGVAATSPSKETSTVPLKTDGSFNFEAAAGTWTTTFTPPANHAFFGDPPEGSTECDPPATDKRCVTQLVEPGEPRPGFDTTLVELGAVEVKLFDQRTGDPITAADVELELSGFASLSRQKGSPDSVVCGVLETPSQCFVYRLDRVLVDSVEPVIEPVEYQLDITVPGYDTRSAVITGDIVATDPVNTDAGNIQVTMVAGKVAVIEVRVPQYGAIQGSLIGITSGDSEPVQTETLQLDAESPAIPATLDVHRVNADGTPLVGDDRTFTKTAGSTAGTFVISGPPGYYKLTPAHPQYNQPSIIPTDTFESTLPAGIFLMRNYDAGNDDANELAAHQLPIIKGTLSVNAVNSLASPVNVVGAVYNLFPGVSTCNATDPATGTAIDTGGTTAAVLPGSYCLTINKYKTTNGAIAKAAFPATVVVSVPRGSTVECVPDGVLECPIPSPDGGAGFVKCPAPSSDNVCRIPGTQRVVAPLPALVPSVTGKLIARGPSPLFDVVELIPDTPGAPQVTRAFVGANMVSINTTDTPNQNTSSETVTAKPTDTGLLPTDYSYTYDFANVPAGLNRFTAPTIDGYTLVTTSPEDKTIYEFGPNTGPTFYYEVAASSVAFRLKDGGVGIPSFPPEPLPNPLPAPPPPAAIRLVSPKGTVYTVHEIKTVDDVPNTLVFSNVSPAGGNWTLYVDSALHEPKVVTNIKIPAKIPKGEGAYRDGGEVTLVADRTRFTGKVEQRSTDTTRGPLEAGGTMTLVRTSPLTGTPSSYTLSGPLTDYSVDVLPGTYTLTVAQAGYITEVIPGINLTGAGRITTRDVEIKKAATVSVTVTGSPALPSGLEIVLLDSANTVFNPDSNTDPAATTTSTTRIFTVPAGTYRARAGAAGAAPPYPSQVSGPVTVGIGVGTPTPLNLPLNLPRLVNVTVNGPATATVRVLNSSGTELVTRTDATTSVFAFSSVTSLDNPTAIPTTGALKVVASATGFRTQTADVASTAIIATPTITLLDNVTVTGAITGADDGDPISATAPAVGLTPEATVSGTISDESYTISGLGVGTLGESRTWTITYDQVGKGIGSTSVTVTPTSLKAVTADITLAVQDISVTFTVTDNATPAIPIGGAIVTMEGTSATPSAPTLSGETGTTGAQFGKVTLTFPETRTALGYTIRHPHYIGVDGTVTIGTSRPIPTVSITRQLAPRLPILGRVLDGGTGVVGATVTICPETTPPAPATQPCASPSFTATSVAGSSPPPPGTPTVLAGQFKFEGNMSPNVLPGTYRVWAVKDAKKGSVVLTVNPTNTYAFTPSGGNISIS
jgi:hypothetical protein